MLLKDKKVCAIVQMNIRGIKAYDTTILSLIDAKKIMETNVVTFGIPPAIDL